MPEDVNEEKINLQQVYLYYEEKKCSIRIHLNNTSLLVNYLKANCRDMVEQSQGLTWKEGKNSKKRVMKCKWDTFKQTRSIMKCSIQATREHEITANHFATNTKINSQKQLQTREGCTKSNQNQECASMWLSPSRQDWFHSRLPATCIHEKMYSPRLPKTR